MSGSDETAVVRILSIEHRRTAAALIETCHDHSHLSLLFRGGWHSGNSHRLAEANWPTADRTRTLLVSAVILIGWLVAAIALGAMGVYDVNASEVPTIQYGIVLPILIGALMIWRSETATRIIDAVPQEWLVGVQLYRALGVIFLILYATGKLPSLFAWPAGIGDIAIGLLAPVVGLA